MANTMRVCVVMEFDEPAGPEFPGDGVEDEEHEGEGRKIEGGGYWPEEEHEAPEEGDVPRDGASSCSLSTRSPGTASWPLS